MRLDIGLNFFFQRVRALDALDQYDIMKHPNVRLTTDGCKPPYIHGEPTQAVATLVFDSDIPKNAVSVKAVSTSYELLSNEDLEEIFNI